LGNQEIEETPDYMVMGRHSYGSIRRIGKDGKIIVGNFTSIANDVKAIMVGHNSGGVSLFPFNARSIRAKFVKGNPKSLRDPVKYYQDILIGHDVWIGYGVILRGGIIINDGAIIGAGSVVTHDVAPYAVEMGNPSKQYRLRFAQSQIDLLLKIRWWEWEDDKIEQNLDVLCSDDIEAFFRRHG